MGYIEYLVLYFCIVLSVPVLIEHAAPLLCYILVTTIISITVTYKAMKPKERKAGDPQSFVEETSQVVNGVLGNVLPAVFEIMRTPPPSNFIAGPKVEEVREIGVLQDGDILD